MKRGATPPPTVTTFPSRLAAWAELCPDAVALREKRLGIWHEMTFADYHDAVRATARALWELGVRPGDAVAILSDNRPEWLFADLGAQAIGAVAVGIYQTNPPPDVAYILDHAGARVLFAEDQEQVDKAIDCRADTPTVEHVVAFDMRGMRHYDDPRLKGWEELIANGRRLATAEPDWYPAQLAARDAHAPAMGVYTSGTTGPPKGALLSSANAMSVALRLSEEIGLERRDTVLSYLPLCHVAEKVVTLFLPMSAGATVHFGESIETVRTDLREVSPTVFLGVPRIWEKMHAGVVLKMRDASWLKRRLFGLFTRLGREVARRRRAGKPRLGDRLLLALGDVLVFRALQERLGLRRCRFALSGAAPISTEILEWFIGVGVPMLEGYGMTEAAGISHFNRPSPPTANRIGTVGQPAPLVEQRLADDGEILIRGPSVFLGYHANAAATLQTIDADGWLHTGDIGTIDADGYLSITGRKKEILITAGGKNLSPEKIENALKTSPYIKEAVAIGDARAYISALVQIDLDAVGDWATRRRLPYTSYQDLSEREEVIKLVDDEITRCNDLLARVEQVRRFRILPKELHQDDGELTATQKVRRRAIHEAYADLIEGIYGRREEKKAEEPAS